MKSCTYALADEVSDLLRLRYTAGHDLDKLRTGMDDVVTEWERYTQAVREAEQDATCSPFIFNYRVDYNRIMFLLGTAILLCRENLIPRIVDLCSVWKGKDSIFDELISRFVDNIPESDQYQWFHTQPYEIVIDAIASDDPAEQASLMKQAVQDWYPANEGEPFYGTHENQTDDGTGGYFGYWCFELAALTVLLGIDDSSYRDHITYPKDLADYYRAHHASTTPAAPPSRFTGLSAYAGEVCPQSGQWHAPHWKGETFWVNAGEKMPGTRRNQAGNEVIWYLKKPE